jgi:hypothetical protein
VHPMPCRESGLTGSLAVVGATLWREACSGPSQLQAQGKTGEVEACWSIHGEGVDLLGEQLHVHMRELVWSAGEEGGLMSCIGALWSSVSLCFGGCLLMVGVLWHWDLGVEGAGLGHGDWTVGQSPASWLCSCGDGPEFRRVGGQ